MFNRFTILSLVLCGVVSGHESTKTACGRQLAREGFRTAIWAGFWCNDESTCATQESLARHSPWMSIETVKTQELRDGVLKGFDALVVPGGYYTQYVEELGPALDSIQAFVRGGGIYIGVCAGAYVASQGNYCGLNFLPNVEARETWGQGYAHLTLTGAGRNLLQAPSVVQGWYKNGPSLFVRPGSGAQVLATYGGFFRAGSHPSETGPSLGSVAAVRQTYGRGTVVLFSLHPEFSPAFQPAISNVLSAVARGY
ncbi:hypothetical protein K2X33_06850 [bacterium]|nr:hypothetical protein [bacterium]